MKLKIFLIAVILNFALFPFILPANVQAYDIASCLALSTESAQIACLQDVVGDIADQIQQLIGNQQTWCHTFNTNLGYAESGTAEVGYLHTALQMQGFSYAPDTGNAYAAGTVAAVSAFQERYASEILTPWGLTAGTGYTGNTTRTKLNQLYACSNTVVTPPTSICTPNWQCGSWSTCSNSQQTRVCTDYNYCGTTSGKPAITQSCASTTCTPNWYCAGWGACSNGVQTQTCIDYNYCGTTANKPATTQSCTSTCTPNWQCTNWSTCSNNAQTRMCIDYNYCGTTSGKPAISQACYSTCTPNWQCTDWSTCSNSSQTRTCIDYNYCGTTSGKPSTTQSCVMPCADTDGGVVYGTKGTATGTSSWDGQTGSYTDSCSGITLTEYSCSNNAIAKSEYGCTYGCSNGACSPQPSITITSPASSAQWSIESQQEISWQISTNSYYFYSIQLVYPVSGITRDIVSSVSGTAPYTWTVGQVADLNAGEQVPAGSYKIKVCIFNSSICSLSNVFSITSPNPSASGGFDSTIFRSAPAQATGTSQGAESVSIYLVKDSSGVETLACTDNTVSTDNGYWGCSWDVPTTLPTGSDYMIKIKVENYTYNKTAISEGNYVTVGVVTPCSETDSGQNYYTGGTSTGYSEENNSYGYYKDTCNYTGGITEYYCSSTGSVKHIDYTCPNGCMGIPGSAVCK